MRTLLASIVVLLSLAAPGALAADPPFSDVPDGGRYAHAIRDFKTKGIIGGYADGTFRPNRPLTRAEFAKLLVAAQVDADTKPCRPRERPFSDVNAKAWYFQAVCIAKKKGIVTGYGDGAFRPAESVTVGEASKMIAVAFGQTVEAAEPWQKPYVEYLAERHAVPVELGSVEQRLTRGQAAEILWRLKEGERDVPSVPSSSLLTARCEWIPDATPDIDDEEVRRVWLQWINDARASGGLPLYEGDRELDRTASLWSSQAAVKGTITHQRPGQTSYYDYTRTMQWFDSLGLTFANEDRATATESIGWGVYSCGTGDCTESLLRGLRSTFDFYMAEKTKESRPHYNSIMHPSFHMLGMGIAVAAGQKKYYVTTHFATAITSHPGPVCP